MSTFSQTGENFYSTISYTRPATTNVKILPRGRFMSTTTSFQPNPTNISFRPQTGIITRSSSSSFRNTKGKLETLG